LIPCNLSSPHIFEQSNENNIITWQPTL
jgi:hypothetical protein